MSQPSDRGCTVDQPGKVDKDLNEFWVGSPWEISQGHNLSSFERNRVFLNVGGCDFVDISYVSGADTDADSRSVMAVDVNGDGQLDMLVRSVGGGPVKLYLNQFPPRRYLKVTLRGTKSNRLGIGARLIARVGKRRFTRELYPVNCYHSQTPSLVHFGLDDAERVDQLVVQWPSGYEQKLGDVPVNQHIVIEEAHAGFEVVRPGTQIAP